MLDPQRVGQEGDTAGTDRQALGGWLLVQLSFTQEGRARGDIASSDSRASLQALCPHSSALQVGSTGRGEVWGLWGSDGGSHNSTCVRWNFSQRSRNSGLTFEMLNAQGQFATFKNYFWPSAAEF